jgi:hypothetical protein
MRTPVRYKILENSRNSSKVPFPLTDIEMWILINPMTLVSLNNFKSLDVSGNSNHGYLKNEDTVLTGDIKLTEVTELHIVPNAGIIAIDNLMTYPFWTDGVSSYKEKYVGDFPADYVYNRDNILFAKIDSGGISNVILFSSARTTSTNPTIAQVEAYLRGEIVYTGVYKTDQNGEPILNSDGGLQFY